jgi:uncharacterized membrane-anchored protein
MTLTVHRPPLGAKVPEITVMFWIIKILTTGMGEAASDWLGGINVVLAGTIGLLGFLAAMTWQLRSATYVATTYWIAVMMVAVFGTMVADVLHVGLDLSYAWSTAFYVVAVAALFSYWHRTEGTLSIHSITTTRRELLYWATVLATFALGTAAGDLTASQLHLGFFGSALLFAGAIVLPLTAWWCLGLNPVVAFWSAYVITRPLGSSFADWFGKPPSFAGGLGYGDGLVTGACFLAFVVLVSYAPARHDEATSSSASRV